MVNPSEKVVVELEARVREFERRIDGARRKFDQDMKGIERSGDRATSRVQGSFGGLGRAAGGFAAAAGVAVGALGALAASRAYIQIVDGAKQIEAQLRLATKETGAFNTAQKDVRRIAQETRTELAATAQLYSVFQRNAADLGITQTESARATETVTKAFRISGATAQEAAGGLRQFLQGVQSGALRGEELNSVLENAPRLAKLLADSLGITIGELRGLGQEGKLTADILIAALTDQKFTEAIDAEFRQLPVTFGEAITQIENAATVVFSAFDEGGQFSTALVNFITQGTGGFEDLEESAREFGIEVRSQIDGVIAFFQPLVDLVSDLGDSLESLGFGDNFLAQLQRILPAFDVVRAITSSESATDARQASRLNLEQGVIDRNIAGLGLSLDTIFDAPRRSGGRPPRAPSGGGGNAARRAASDAAKAERDRISAIRDAAQFEQQIADLTQSVADAKEALLTAERDVLRFALARNEFERETAQRQIDLGQEIGDLTKEQADQLRSLNDDRADLRRELILRVQQQREFRQEERRLERQASVASELGFAQAEILDAQLALARTSRERAEIDAQLINLAFDEERARNDFLIAYAQRLEAQQELLGLEQEEIDEAKAQAEIARARNSTLEQRRGLAQQGSSEANAAPLQSFLQSIPQTADELNEALESVAANGLSSLVDGLTDAIVNFRSLGDVGRAILAGITADLIKLGLQQLILQTIGQTAGNATVAANVAQGAAVAAGWAPAAALASLATLGANAGPAAAALATTNALAQALALTPGLQDGGPVIGPGGPRDDKVVRRLSRGEYVLNERASRSIGRSALDYMNANGAMPIGLRDGGPVWAMANAPAAMTAPASPRVVAPQMYVDARGAVMADEFARQILRQSKEFAADAGRQSYAASMRDAPGAVRRDVRFTG